MSKRYEYEVTFIFTTNESVDVSEMAREIKDVLTEEVYDFERDKDLGIGKVEVYPRAKKEEKEKEEIPKCQDTETENTHE